MSKEKKQKKQSGAGAGVLLIVMGIIFAILSGVLFMSSSDYIFNGPKDLSEMLETNGKPVNGEYVSVEVDAVIDWYAETQYKINGIIPAGKKKHAIVWLDNDTMMGITVKSKKDIEMVDGLIEGTWKWLLGTSGNLPSSVKIEGKVKNIGTEVTKYYNEAKGYVKQSLGEYEFYDLEIDLTDNKTTVFLYVGFLLVVAIAMLASGVSTIRTAKKQKAQALAQTQTMYQEQNQIQSQDQIQNQEQSIDDNLR